MHAGALSLCSSAANGDACLWGQLSSCRQQISHQGVCGFKIAHLCHDMCCAVLCHDMRCDVLCMLSVACHSWAALHGTETGSG